MYQVMISRLALMLTENHDDSTWTPSPRSSRKKRKGRQQDRPSLLSRIRSVQGHLDSQWFNNCTKILESHINIGDAMEQEHDVICLGLGSPESSENARVQLAFLLGICDVFEIKYSKISAYDPVFTDEDKSLFRQLEVLVLDSNWETNIGIDRPTILFMPHCDLDLYESVLGANWTLDRLENIIFICNHFDDYVQNNSARALESKAPHVLKIAPAVTSTPLPASPDWLGAFNNTSVQIVSKDDARTLMEIDEKCTG